MSLLVCSLVFAMDQQHSSELCESSCRKSCFIYIDDVLVASKRNQEHLDHLHEVFICLCAANLKLKLRNARKHLYS